MLKSLEKLRDGVIFGEDGFELSTDKARNLADEIQAEVDKFYLLRPLFEGGEPADFGMEFVDWHGDARRIEEITWGSVRCRVSDEEGHSVLLEKHNRLSRPPEPDTQEKINDDNMLTPIVYCDKHGIAVRQGESAGYIMRRHILARQRKLDGVE